MHPIFDLETETALDAYLNRHPNIGSREHAVEKIVKLWLAENGFLSVHQTGTRPEELDASNDD